MDGLGISGHTQMVITSLVSGWGRERGPATVTPPRREASPVPPILVGAVSVARQRPPPSPPPSGGDDLRTGSGAESVRVQFVDQRWRRRRGGGEGWGVVR